MKIKQFLSVLAVAAFLTPAIGHAEDSASDANRTEPKVYAKDALITTKVKAKLAEYKASTLVNVSVDTVNNGKVTLSGTTKSEEAKKEAVKIAKATEGVHHVKNEITIKTDD